MKKMPPYELLAYGGSVLLIIFVILAYRVFPGEMPVWTFAVAWAVAGMVAVGVLLKVYLMVRDYQAGTLYPMRNASFFVLVVCVIGIPLFLIYSAFIGAVLQSSTLLLIPVFLFFAVRNLFRVRLDNITFLAKTGFRSPVEVPLFDITDVEFEDRRITVSTEGGKRIQLLRTFFFPAHWEALSAKLSAYDRQA